LKISVRCLVMLLTVILVSSLLAACSGGKETSTQVQSNGSSSTANAGSQTLPSASSGTTVPAAGSTVSSAKPGGIADLADIKSLSSYRMCIKTSLVEGEGAGSVTSLKYEWVRDQKAEHAWMEDGTGRVTEVYITIGDRNWIWMGAAGMGWIEQPAQTNQSSSLPADLASQLKKAQQDVNSTGLKMTAKGSETVNNVRCARYEFDYSSSVDMPNFSSGGTTKTAMHSSGNVWVADQTGIPAVMVKSLSRSEVTAAGVKSVIDSEQNLTDIGATIKINVPEGSQGVPGMPNIPGMTPSIPGGIPSVPPTPGTNPPQTPVSTPTPTTGTGVNNPVFTDAFDGKLNSKWEWTDPGDDANYNLAVLSGFLRMSVPDGNDLAWLNCDAPRLTITQKGDFTIETLVEFDPSENYQGAGLLVWQDENTFLRLEFGYGGLGDEVRKAAFLVQENGNLELIDSLELAETVKKVELRITRSGSFYTAEYRQGSGPWQSAGSIELDLNPNVEVGICQVTMAPDELKADFDYFKLYTK
jgi:regulation of enolase protein 1 (concanavalin A-like superfamily)